MANQNVLNRRRPRIKLRHKPGTDPGNIDDTSALFSEVKHLELSITVHQYTDSHCEVKKIKSLHEMNGLSLQPQHKLWVEISGHIAGETIQLMESLFKFHRLALEDAVHLKQLPKYEDFAKHLHIILRVPRFDQKVFTSEQISIYVDGSRNLIVSVQESLADPFSLVRERLSTGKGRLRSQSTQHLAYALIDAVIDSYFVPLETFASMLDKSESDILRGNSKIQDLIEVHDLKSQLLQMQRLVYAHRELTARLADHKDFVISDDLSLYLRDCRDHCQQQIELLTIYHDNCASMMDLAISVASHRTNEIMRTLTLVAAIFIPLTFIVGVYGMNFSPEDSPWSMPELRWRYGYPLVWGVMIAIGFSMFFWFRKRQWL